MRRAIKQRKRSDGRSSFTKRVYISLVYAEGHTDLHIADKMGFLAMNKQSNNQKGQAKKHTQQQQKQQQQQNLTHGCSAAADFSSTTGSDLIWIELPVVFEVIAT